MSRPGCQQTSAKPCNRNAEESFPVLSLKSQEQKPPNPLLIQDKNALQPRLALILGTAASLALARYTFPGRQWLNTFFMSPLIFPPIITGIALLQFFSTLGIRATFFTLMVGHTLITIPYVVRTVTASLQGLRSNVEEAARLLGANPWQTFWYITLPLIKPGLLAGGIFAFITSFDNYTISMWLKSAEETPLPLRIFFYIERIMDPSVAAVSGAMILFSIVLVIVTEKAVGLSRAMNV